MPDWPRQTIANCLDRVAGFGVPTVQASAYKTSGLYPIVDQGKGLIAGWTDDAAGLISEKLPVVVFGDHTRAFKYVDFPFVRGADGTQLLKPKEGIDPLFFYYACQTVDLPNRGYNRHFGALKEKEIPIPSFEEQLGIGQGLRLLEKAIALQLKEVRSSEVLKRMALRALFTRGLRGEPQKETEIGPVPESWNVGPLVQFAEFQRGFDITKEEQSEGSVPVVSSGGVKSFHNVAGAKGPGVVIGRKGSIGLLHFVNEDYWPHDTTLWCKDYKGNVPKFVYYRLHSVDMKRLDSGAANPALNRNFLHNEILSWPKAEEQHEITSVLDTIDRKIELHGRKRAILADLFEALLLKLMTGEIRVAKLDLSGLIPNTPESAVA
jgi:type I restriction enzyme, S subunit